MRKVSAPIQLLSMVILLLSGIFPPMKRRFEAPVALLDRSAIPDGRRRPRMGPRRRATAQGAVYRSTEGVCANSAFVDGDSGLPSVLGPHR